jgi:hypothetical protein
MLKKIKLVWEPLKANVVELSHIKCPQLISNDEIPVTLYPEVQVAVQPIHCHMHSVDEPQVIVCSHPYVRNLDPSATKVRFIAKLFLADDIPLDAKPSTTGCIQYISSNIGMGTMSFRPYMNRRLWHHFCNFYEPKEEHQKYLNYHAVADCGVPSCSLFFRNNVHRSIMVSIMRVGAMVPSPRAISPFSMHC